MLGKILKSEWSVGGFCERRYLESVVKNNLILSRLYSDEILFNNIVVVGKKNIEWVVFFKGSLN